MPKARAQRFAAVRIGPAFLLAGAVALTLALRLNGGWLSDSLGVVPFLYLASTLVGGLFVLRSLSPELRAAHGAKLLAGMHVAVLVLFIPLWAGKVGAIGSALLFLPLILYAGWSGTQALCAPSGEARLVKVVCAIVPERMATLVVAEVRLLALALFAWGRPRRRGPSAGFTSASVLAPVLLAVAAVSTVEILVVHLVLARWSTAAAWIASGIGLVTFLYLLGLAKSLLYLPSRVQHDALLVRLGHLHCFEIPYPAIVAADSAPPCTAPRPETLNLAIMSSPNVIVELVEPRTILGLSGRTRSFDRIALRMDNPAGFLAALEPKLARESAPATA